MIARVKFEGIVKDDGKKRSVLPDHIDIHVPPGGLQKAKEIFMSWLANNAAGIKGDSGVFHPLREHGDIKLKGVEEAK